MRSPTRSPLNSPSAFEPSTTQPVVILIILVRYHWPVIQTAFRVPRTKVEWSVVRPECEPPLPFAPPVPPELQAAADAAAKAAADLATLSDAAKAPAGPPTALVAGGGGEAGGEAAGEAGGEAGEAGEMGGHEPRAVGTNAEPVVPVTAPPAPEALDAATSAAALSEAGAVGLEPSPGVSQDADQPAAAASESKDRKSVV